MSSSDSVVVVKSRSAPLRDKEGATIEVRYYATDVIPGAGDEFSFTEDEVTPLVFKSANPR